MTDESKIGYVLSNGGKTDVLQGDSVDVEARIATQLSGHHLMQVERNEQDWSFHFTNNVRLVATCPWRILEEGRIAFGDEDHVQQFGLPQPMDGVERCSSLLHDKSVQDVRVRDDSGDLTIVFDKQLALEILNNSCGFEGWHLSDGTGLHVVAMGGGELALWNENE